QRVQVETGDGLVNLRYANLVVALGAVSRTLPIPGLAEHGRGFKSLADAIALRNHVLRRLEAAAAAPNEAHRERELTFVFVGAGYAGVEALAELSDLVRDALRYYPSLRENPHLSELGMPVDDKGRVIVDGTLRVEGLARVWALGDGARVPNEATPGHFDPPTCQHALRQARRLAKNLRGDPRPYRYRML